MLLLLCPIGVLVPGTLCCPSSPSPQGSPPSLCQCPGLSLPRTCLNLNSKRFSDEFHTIPCPSLRPLPRGSCGHIWAGATQAVPWVPRVSLAREGSPAVLLLQKITTKNAFVLHLIDYMTDILKEKNSELTNFQVAAGTLDASAKIYAVRVDSVHADAFRVLGHLGKDPSEVGFVPFPTPGSSPAPEAARKAQPRKKQSFKTIEQNLSNINVSETGRRAEAEFPIQAGIPHPGRIPHPGGNSPSRQELPIQAGIPHPGGHSCSSRVPVLQSVSALLEKFRKSEQVFDPNVDPDSEDGEGWAPSQPEFQLESPTGDGIQEFQENGGDSLGTVGNSKRWGRGLGRNSQSCEEFPVLGAPFGAGDIGALSLRVSLNPGEYSYFSPRTLSMWAGPEHWRFRPRHARDQNNPNFSMESRRSFPIFHGASQNPRSTTLPADFHYHPQNMAQLFLKPLVKEAGIEDCEAGIGDYDYNNPNDTSNFCPAPQVPASSHCPRDGKTLGFLLPEPALGSALAQFHGDGKLGMLITVAVIPMLIPMVIPDSLPQIHKIPIQYARTAKRMDMRRLKRNMWELLTGIPLGAGMGNPRSSAFLPAPIPFSHRLPPAMATNLSVPLAFVCLLHLANEKNLRLESTEDLSDILVTQGH
uniref:Condensin complex subunit 2 n=1 Tax=Cyanoderma ruficeps TaxID=181631 RepID=A0A8C3R3V7_9PASS